MAHGELWTPMAQQKMKHKPHMAEYLSSEFNSGYLDEKDAAVGEDGGDHGDSAAQNIINKLYFGKKHVMDTWGVNELRK